ncbi:acyl esterase [Paenibacillus sp. FSL H7-0357]|uniref:CocE/NonD family hydrolase n=1 Tax=unclassified Paenibacillus TaxID=185978 RepID=UPI0004F68C0F|nr:CocE/NonD family hydrolase [Paenibacillus sp. FSL H7-0357]AIQ17393.1 acyl esterase [Paenibacillus sp. FSL H7-0357]
MNPLPIDTNERSNHFYELTWKEVKIPMRDGNYLAANLYQPNADGDFPVIMTMCPYGKDTHFSQFAPANPTVAIEYTHLQDKGPLLSWETPNPEYWVPQGYAVLRVDERGIGNSPGKLDILSSALKKDYYDAIEWAGTQAWSNGRIGLLGISYLAMSQWAVASEQPPHLACIIPWEGTVDYYADFCYPGGIQANGFLSFWWKNGVLTHQYNPGGSLSEEQLQDNRIDFPEMVKNNPLRDQSWTNRFSDLSKVEVPLLSASNWFSAGMHTRGNFLGFQNAASEHKWLEVHIGSHVGEFYTAQGRELQKKFLDYWLKGIDTGITREPKVKLAIPRGGNSYTWRYENEYPLMRTQWTRFYLDASSKLLSVELPQAKSQLCYDGDKERESRHWAEPFMVKAFSREENNSKRILFETAPLENETEILGPIKLRLWASSTTDDMDIFVSLRNIDPLGNEVVNSGALTDQFPISQGWLRASLRKTDDQISAEYKPYYSFDEIQKLIPGEVYPLDIEIWDSAIVVAKGNRLLLEIGSQNQSGCALLTQTADDRVWEADVTLYTGDEFDSYLLLPIIP